MKHYSKIRRFLTDPEVLIVTGLWLLVFFLFGTPFPYHYDSVNYALAIAEKFDIGMHQPHPPGYLFHIMFGRVLYLFIKNPFYVQQVQNVIYLFGMVGCLYMVRERKPCQILFLGTLPLILFFPAVPIIHAASLMFGCWVAFCIGKLEKGEWSPYLLALIFAISLGFRQDMIILLGPVVLYAFICYKCTPKQWVVIFTIGAAVTSLWYFPTRLLSSGLEPFEMTNKMNVKFYEKSSVFMGAALFENVRTALRFLIYSLGVLGPGGLVAVYVASKKLSLRQWVPILLTVAPIVIYGVIFLLSFSYYYASALGFFAVWALQKNGLPQGKKVLVVLTLLNILFFALMPMARYTEWRGSFAERSFTENVAKQLLYAGANSRDLIVNKRDLLTFADTTAGRASSFYAQEGIIWDRFWNYLSEHEWGNSYVKDKESAEVIITRSEIPGTAPFAKLKTVRAYRIDNLSERLQQETR